jgi:replicative DNA helicase
MTTNLEYCNFYSDKGWRVFPCKSDKKPAVFDWPNEATTDKAKIAAWWGGNPNAGIGLATGKQSGIFAIDIDAGHNGFETLAGLPAMPETVMSNTGGGGKHILFRYPEVEIRNSASKVGQGIDCRGEGGYIVVPKSPHPSGHFYEWDREHLPSKYPVADAPAWLLKLLVDDKPQIVTTPTDGAYISGQRNSALTSMAGAMKRKGFTEASIFMALNVENLNRCVPPLLEAEVRAIAASVSRYEATASMPLSNRDRATAEWGLVKCVYEWPNIANEYSDVTPSDFGQKELSDFWTSVRSGIDVTTSATNSGIMAELEKAEGYQVDRVGGYVKAIKHYAYHASMLRMADTLKQHAAAGNNCGVEKALNEINKIPTQSENRTVSIGDTIDALEARIMERQQNPTDVWGIPYAWDYVSKLTGGKQKGELILIAAEPGAGKSWWCLQDALYTAINDVPVKYWSGEMKRDQLMERLCQILGVSRNGMKSGHMSESDWQAFKEARAIVMNSPLYLDDRPLYLHEIRPMLTKEKAEFGIQQVVFDYESLITAPGKDETEQSANTSRELKKIAQDLDLSIILISSVNKAGMDQDSSYASKSNIRGSGQKIHDADIVYIMTKFDESKGMEYRISINDYKTTVLMKIKKGRELVGVENGFLVYQREPNSPKFKEIVKQKG